MKIIKKIILLTCYITFTMVQLNAQNNNNLNNKQMENTLKPIEVVEGFFNAMNKGDFDLAKSFMADNHQYIGPMFSTENPDDYFKKLMAFEMEFAVETQDMIVAENGVTHLALLKVINPVQASIPTCEVFKVEDGKITHQHFYFDTALFPSK